MPITIGTHPGSHEITALHGKGGMGEVYRACDTKLKREVGIKILPEEFSRDADRVLELVEGKTLAGRIARGAISVEDALKIPKSICKALEAAREKGIVDQDLKPANVKITRDGDVKMAQKVNPFHECVL
jgi:serine/threonine protein kinase